MEERQIYTRLIKKSKTILSIAFMFMGLTFLSITLYWVYSAAFLTGFGGSKVNFPSLLWSFRGFIFASVYSTIAFVGVRKLNPHGFVFGYALAIASLLFLAIDTISSGMGSAPFVFKDLLFLFILVGGPIIIILHLYKLRSFAKLGMKEYIAIVAFAALLCSSLLAID